MAAKKKLKPRPSKAAMRAAEELLQLPAGFLVLSRLIEQNTQTLLDVEKKLNVLVQVLQRKK
jgi:hypothetical protein